MKVYLLAADGTFDVMKAEIDTEFPTVAVARGKKQEMRFTLSEGPIFSHMKPIPLAGYQEVSHLESPTDIPHEYRHLMIAEANAFFPVSVDDPPDYQKRERERQVFHAQATQNARGKAARTNDKDNLMSMWSVVLAFVVAVMTLIFGAVALSARFGGDDGNPPKTVAPVSTVDSRQVLPALVYEAGMGQGPQYRGLVNLQAATTE